MNNRSERRSFIEQGFNTLFNIGKKTLVWGWKLTKATSSGGVSLAAEQITSKSLLKKLGGPEVAMVAGAVLLALLLPLLLTLSIASSLASLINSLPGH